MKKVLVVLFCASLMLGGFSSCNKKCKCTTYLAGKVTKEEDVKLQSGKRCSDLSTVLTVDGTKTGYDCTPTL